MNVDQNASGILATAIKRCRRHLVAAAVFSAFVNILYIAPTLYMLQVYDRVVPTHGLQTLAFLTFALLVALATLSILDRIRARLLIRAGVQLDSMLAPEILEAAFGQPHSPISRQALRDLDLLRGVLVGSGILALFDAPWTPIYILICFLVHPAIGLVALVGCAILPAIAWANERATRTRLDHSQNVASASYANQTALLGVADSIRALGMRRALIARQLRTREAMTDAQTEASFSSGNYLTATKFTRLSLQSLALGLGALLAVENQISGGAIFASSFLITRALSPIEQLIGTWKTTVQARQSYRSLGALLARAASEMTTTRLPPPIGKITLEGLTVLNHAGGGAILNQISIEIGAGQFIAIVGSSGAGKSTLVRAIAGALLPDRGSVRFDDADSRDWDSERLASHLGYLPQECDLIAGSVAENIARFSGELREDKDSIDVNVVAAAKLVGADSLIRHLSGGYNYRLSLGGKGLSAGQAQRIALARAAFGTPSVLILDEPNAHLDREGDTALAEALSQMKAAGSTIIVVSHKMNILPLADKILVLQAGRVELFGARDDVLAKLVPPDRRRADERMTASVQ